MAIDTTDVRSHGDAQILHAIEVIGRSEDRRQVFQEIYRGKSNGKTAEQIDSKIKIGVVRVLQEALILYKAKIIREKKINGRLTYIKDEFFSLHKERILRQITNDLVRGKVQSKIMPTFQTPAYGLPSVPKTKITRSAIRKPNSINEKANIIRILFLAANPKNTVSLRLDEEVREIEQKILLAQKKDQLVLIKKGAVRASDLQFYLNQERPTIVHFSGHGTDEGKIVLEDKIGNPMYVSSEALASVFKTLKDNVRCVVLNACFSIEQAHAINRHVDFVIGMSSSINDEAAIAFSYAFYLGLSSERSIQNAFDQGITEVLLQGFSGEENTPKLLCKDNIDPSKIFLLT